MVSRSTKTVAQRVGLASLAAVFLSVAAWPQLGRFAVQVPEGGVLTDPVARLQNRMDAGELSLEFDSERGYLESVLDVLEIPSSSQSVVFSKTSFQADRIDPDNPRTLFFNDDVYVGWVPGGPVLELASVDPVYGTMFYTIEQSDSGSVRFEREGSRCSNCHLPTRSNVPIPRLMMMSVVPNETGEALGSNVLVTTDRSPVETRWGGWFVTGIPQTARHVGNMVVGGARNEAIHVDADAHLATVANRLRLPESESDAVALMLLAHQSEIHNLIGEAAYAVRALEAGVGGSGEMTEREMERVGEAVEPLVRALLFVDASRLNGLGDRDSDFAREFVARGPRDRLGRSLRDLELEDRLLRHSLSYLVYSEGFDGLPDLARDYVYARFVEIFEARERSAAFAHLTADDRVALMEILRDTKPSFREWLESL